LFHILLRHFFSGLPSRTVRLGHAFISFFVNFRLLVACDSLSSSVF